MKGPSSFATMAAATKAESRYALACRITPCGLHLVAQAYLLSNCKPTKDQIFAKKFLVLAIFGGGRTTSRGTSNFQFLHGPFVVAATNDVGKRNQIRGCLCGRRVDSYKGNFEDGFVVVLPCERVCALDCPVNVVGDILEECFVVVVSAEEVAEDGTDLSLVWIGGGFGRVGGVAVDSGHLLSIDRGEEAKVQQGRSQETPVARRHLAGSGLLGGLANLASEKC